MRLDKAIFERKLTQSRSRAELLIDDGAVMVNGVIAKKASLDVNENDLIEVYDSIGYVGRGGLKLEYAIKQFDIMCDGLDALDIGASTGGFTQCLLKNGVNSVVAVDVGHGQMAEEIKGDSRVTLLEDTNAKAITPEIIFGKKDIAVMDVSFISQASIYPAMFACLKENGFAITLVKPQFEADSRALSKKGIIKDKSLYREILKRTALEASKFDYSITDICTSPILGGDGNTEFLIKLEKHKSAIDTDLFLGVGFEKNRNIRK